MNVNRGGRQAGTCRSCSAEIAWVTTAKGKAMPIDADPHAIGGEVDQRLEDVRGLVFSTPFGWRVVTLKTQPTEFAGRTLHKAHFATCPNAAAHRSRA